MVFVPLEDIKNREHPTADVSLGSLTSIETRSRYNQEKTLRALTTAMAGKWAGLEKQVEGRGRETERSRTFVVWRDFPP